MNATLTMAAPRGTGMLMSTDDPVDYGRLIEAVALRRDREAYARLFVHFAPRLKAYLMRAGATSGAAEDFAQEALLTVWRKAELYDPSRAAASAWVFTIARNLRIDTLRRDRAAVPKIDLSQMPDDPLQPDAIMTDQDRVGRVRKALETLSKEQASVVQLSFFHDKAHSEIARELGLPLGTVKSRLRLAMLRLRDMLGDL